MEISKKMLSIDLTSEERTLFEDAEVADLIITLYTKNPRDWSVPYGEILEHLGKEVTKIHKKGLESFLDKVNFQSIYMKLSKLVNPPIWIVYFEQKQPKKVLTLIVGEDLPQGLVSQSIHPLRCVGIDDDSSGDTSVIYTSGTEVTYLTIDRSCVFYSLEEANIAFHNMLWIYRQQVCVELVDSFWDKNEQVCKRFIEKLMRSFK